MEKLPLFGKLQEDAQIDAHNSDAAVQSVAQSGIAKVEAGQMQASRNEESEHTLACVDTVSQDSRNGCLARIRT